jgi:pimeloyl-ACP methyl ester carboxylesterase
MNEDVMQRRWIVRAQICLALATTLVACTTSPETITEVRKPQGLTVNPTPLGGPSLDATSALPSMWSREIQGTTESGSFYDMLFPTAWNGRLLIVVHGLVDPALPVKLPARTPAEDVAGASGYAVAFSSFSENGWAVKDGAQRTHELVALFTQAFGAPSHIYLYGQSMGSLIALDLAESFPTQFDGVVAECGILGGSYARFRYMLDVRLLFDYFYPGVLEGSALGVPPGISLDTTRSKMPARAAMTLNRDGAVKIAQITQTPVPYVDPQPGSKKDELIESIVDQLFRHAREINDLMARGHGEPPVDRSEYTSATLDPALLADINAKVPRFSAGKSAAHYSAQYYEPTGNLRIPVLTLYTERDPALPASMSELLYARRVAATGSSGMFRRMKASTAYGHCTGTQQNRLTAVQTLVDWVEKGHVPPE